jgi:hypothetical protein
MFSIIQQSTNFYNEFYVYIVVWIFCSIKNDEKNCNIVSGDFFYNVFWNANSNYMK